MSTEKQRIKAATPRNKTVDDTIARLGSTYFAWVREHEDAATTFRHALHELMRDAGINAGDIGYINAHGTSTQAGDVTEIKALRRVFGEGNVPKVGSTKSLTGHSLGATGVHEAIYSLIMMNNDFIAASANVRELDPQLDPSEIVTTLREGVKLDSVLSNSFGFGGTNGTLVFKRA